MGIPNIGLYHHCGSVFTEWRTRNPKCVKDPLLAWEMAFRFARHEAIQLSNCSKYTTLIGVYLTWALTIIAVPFSRNDGPANRRFDAVNPKCVKDLLLCTWQRDSLRDVIGWIDDFIFTIKQKPFADHAYLGGLSGRQQYGLIPFGNHYRVCVNPPENISDGFVGKLIRVFQKLNNLRERYLISFCLFLKHCLTFLHAFVMLPGSKVKIVFVVSIIFRFTNHEAVLKLLSPHGGLGQIIFPKVSTTTKPSILSFAHKRATTFNIVGVAPIFKRLV